MREVNATDIANAVARLCIEANCVLGEDLLAALRQAQQKEESETGREILSQLLENARLGREERVPTCQDTGVAVAFVELGQDARIVGGSLREAIDEGVRRGYKDGYLRASILGDPLARRNTGDNTPAVIHVESVPGDRLRLTLMAKGGGCENMSRLAMLTPAQGRDGVIRFVVDAVAQAGANPCPPIIVGVGLGGTFEQAALISKKALLRPVGQPSANPETAALERDLLAQINALGIGPQGLGGRITALAVHVETYPCHIASLPVAVNIECHAHRHGTVVL
ncbi:MAG: fumarate hydratase [Planctomycetes bacterium]|nr:fumarate hydratase [Planctomycetota bacterium]